MSIFNSLGMAGTKRNFERNFQEFSDDIFDPDRTDGISTLAQNFVEALENGDFADIADGIKFKVFKTQDDGLQFIFSDKHNGEHKLYLSENDARLFFDELVAIREGLWKDVDLEDNINNISMRIAVTQYDTYSVVINHGNKLVCDIVGSLGVIQKLEYYILYAKYYNYYTK